MPLPFSPRRRTLLAAALLSAPFSMLHAQTPQLIAPPRPPQLLVGGAERPVTLRSVRVDAEIAGSLALTQVEMVFFNPNARILEGELQFPLLDGQSIAGFALDIDGKLREAVPVEKARGQAVFEDITRARIDPALLQVTQGNNFKLRVYPLLPGQTRTVVIRYSEPLAGAGPQRLYRLPLSYANLQTFSLRLRATGSASAPFIAPHALGALAFRRISGAWLAEADRTDFTADGLLEVAVAAPREALAHTQSFNGRTYFYAEVPVASVRTPRRAPKVVALAWDSSGSGASRDHAKELALLSTYFRWMQNGEVLLVRLRDTAEPPQRFSIAGGNWRALRRALEATVYDGATNLAAYTAPESAEETLLFSDGLSNFGGGRLVPAGKPLHTVSAAVRSDPAALRGLAEASGGRHIDLLAEPVRAAAGKLINQWARVASIEADGAEEIVLESAYPSQGRLALAGVLRSREAWLRIDVGTPGGPLRTLEVPVRAGARAGSLAAGLWARLRIAELEAEHELNRAEILRVGKSFGVVTRETSLIVLDRVEDYARHEIVPPQELRAEYNRLIQTALQRRETDRRNHIEQVVRQFREKEAWWNREFPKEGAARQKIGRDDRAMRRESAPAAPSRMLESARGQIGARGLSADVSMAGPEARMAQAMTGTSPAPAAISIQLKPSQSDAPYARRMRNADGRNAYLVYLDEKPGYAASTAFFLDAADLLFDKKQPELAVRVLSNLAEMDLENRHILRILGYRLLQAERASLAVRVFQKVLELAPEEPQSWRDLGLALAADKQYQKAVEALYEVVVRPWHGRFPEIELIALAELNAIVAASGAKLDLARMDARLLKNLPLDLRVVLSWDADNTDIDLWVTDPNGERAFYGHRLTYQGGRMSQDFTGGYGPEEFSLRNAKPGVYRVDAQFYGHRQQVVAGATTLQLKFASRFGSPQQQEQIVTRRLSGQGELVFVGEFTVKPDPAGSASGARLDDGFQDHRKTAAQ